MASKSEILVYKAWFCPLTTMRDLAPVAAMLDIASTSLYLWSTLLCIIAADSAGAGYCMVLAGYCSWAIIPIPILMPIPFRGLGALGERLGLAGIILTPCQKSSGLGVAMLIDGIAG